MIAAIDKGFQLRLSVVVLVVLSLLMLIWSLPGTIALSNLLLTKALLQENSNSCLEQI